MALIIRYAYYTGNDALQTSLHYINQHPYKLLGNKHVFSAFFHSVPFNSILMGNPVSIAVLDVFQCPDKNLAVIFYVTSQYKLSDRGALSKLLHFSLVPLKSLNRFQST